MPERFKSLARIKYFPETDTLYLTAYTNERPHIGKEWGTVGTEIVPYDNRSQSRNIRWRLTLPYHPSDHPDSAAKNFLVIKAIDIAGDRIFATRVLQAEVYVYDTATGTLIAKLKPGIEVARESGWVDIPYGLRTFHRTNGDCLVLVEEDAKAKVIMYRLGQREGMFKLRKRSNYMRKFQFREDPNFTPTQTFISNSLTSKLFLCLFYSSASSVSRAV